MADEFLNDLQDIMTTHGIEETKAALIIRHISRQYGGNCIYIKMQKKTDLKKRDCEIFERFNGKNLVSLSRDFGLSSQQLRKIIATKRAEHLTN